MALTTGEAASVLPDESVVAIGLLKDKLVGEGSFCGVLDFGIAGVLADEADVVADGVGEQKRVLADE